jgi:hypothetical protein
LHKADTKTDVTSKIIDQLLKDQQLIAKQIENTGKTVAQLRLDFMHIMQIINCQAPLIQTQLRIIHSTLMLVTALSTSISLSIHPRVLGIEVIREISCLK